MAPTGNALEEWHRYVVPTLLDRLQKRLKQHCDDHHQPWPARTRLAHHQAVDQTQLRLLAFGSDLYALASAQGEHIPTTRPTDEHGLRIEEETGVFQ